MDSSSATEEERPSAKTEETGAKQQDARRRRVYRVLGVIFLVAATVLAIYGTVVLLALDRGQILREENARRALQDEVAAQLDLATADIEAGSLNLADRRLEWVLARDPGNARAQQLLQQLEQALGRRLTPSPSPAPTQTPDAATPETQEAAAAATEFSRLEALLDAGDWERAVEALPAFQARYPDFRRSQTDSMLYEAYIQRGLALINGPRVELGLFYLDQAERLGDLPVEVEDQRGWAELYLLGIGTYQVDWAAAVGYFRDLCAAAPFYQEACELLYDSLTAYADQFAAAGEFCPAEPLYREAWNLGGDVALDTALQNAVQQCREATPTPEAVTPESETTPVDGTPVDGTPTEGAP